MLVRVPMRMEPVSPRSRQWNQIPVSAPISTSPITTAVGAMKASSAIRGVTPSSENTVPYGQRDNSGINQLPFSDTGTQPQHQGDVLDGGARGTFAQIVQPSDQYRLPIGFIPGDK